MDRAEPPPGLASSGVGTRIGSAIVLAPPALAAAWFGGPLLAIVVIAAAAGMGWEWARLTGCSAALMMVTMAAIAAVPSVSAAFGAAGIGMGAVALCAVVASARTGRMAWLALGTAWIAIPCAAVVWLDQVAGHPTILWLFLTVWATDTGAFVAGRAIGGPRLAPLLSPNKTWAGFVGGLVAAGVLAALVARPLGASIALLVPVSLAVAVAAHSGDLAESFAKRHFGVKDSGHLIPGHGGLLDRLDGMLAAAALAALLTLAAGTGPLAWRG